MSIERLIFFNLLVVSNQKHISPPLVVSNQRHVYEQPEAHHHPLLGRVFLMGLPYFFIISLAWSRRTFTFLFFSDFS